MLTEGMFLIQLSSNAGISVCRIVWAMTNSCFTSDMFLANISVTNHLGILSKIKLQLLFI